MRGRLPSETKYVVSMTMEKGGLEEFDGAQEQRGAEKVRSRRRHLMHGSAPWPPALSRTDCSTSCICGSTHGSPVGTVDDMLFSEGNNARLQLTGTRVLDPGVVPLSYHVARGRAGRLV